MRLKHSVAGKTEYEHKKIALRYITNKGEILLWYIGGWILISYLFFISWGGKGVAETFVSKYLVATLTMIFGVWFSIGLMYSFLYEWRNYIPIDLNINEEGITWRSLSGMHTISFGQLKRSRMMTWNQGTAFERIRKFGKFEDLLDDFIPFSKLKKQDIRFKFYEGYTKKPFVIVKDKNTVETIGKRVQELTEKYLNYIINIRKKERRRELERLEV